ncbi:hypothetical protein L228DRAFT_238188 [Xylona heveae TC161]|uniref:Basic proline-rich protein n=1 Tax=Xylona heveae (strain CBS 132557 / TC161) TaxID=1328760 RepID=A0A165HKJ8_XYLHT|nr:hypothetical protein L228DRAFT_238188 [Xylona heveae TC161]KZF23651.1 hypothetical protein L228DRAFT_238188 [Xylona heveae TC161]
MSEVQSAHMDVGAEASAQDSTANERVPNSPLLMPTIARRSTEPTEPDSLSRVRQEFLPLRPRNRSPYARSHLRSQSSHSPLGTPMTRAHSLPGVDSGGRVLPEDLHHPPSPLGSLSRLRSHSQSPTHTNAGDYPAQGLDADHIPRSTCRSDSFLNAPSAHVKSGNTFPRRRRPSSPLNPLAQGGAAPSTSTSASSSPLIAPTKFNESYPKDYNFNMSFSSSSLPSTPTSARSRSPSISSLETIPDSPAAEEAALEAENLAKLKAAAEASDAANTGPEQRSASDSIAFSKGGLGSFGFYGSRDKRKRWSVCGAERRGDLDLETIWED